MLQIMNNPNVDLALQVVGILYLTLSLLANLPKVSDSKVGKGIKTVVADVGPLLALLGSLLGKKVVPAVPPTDEQPK